MGKRYLKNKRIKKDEKNIRSLKVAFGIIDDIDEVDTQLSQDQIDDVVDVFPGESFNTAPVSYERFKEAYPEYLRRCMAHTK